MMSGYYINTRKVWRDVWSYDWRQELFLRRMAELRDVSAEWLAEQAHRLTGNLRACMRDAEPGNDFTVHYSWPYPVVKILAGRGLMYPLESDDVLSLTGRGWGVRLLMQGVEPFAHGYRDFTHMHWETWWPPAEMQTLHETISAPAITEKAPE